MLKNLENILKKKIYIYQIRLSYDMTNHADLGGCYPPRPWVRGGTLISICINCSISFMSYLTSFNNYYIVMTLLLICSFNPDFISIAK